MNALRHEFFARARFPRNHHRGIALRDHPHQPVHLLSFITRFRNDASALAIRLRWRDTNKLGMAVAAMSTPRFPKIESAHQRALIYVARPEKFSQRRQEAPVLAIAISSPKFFEEMCCKDWLCNNRDEHTVPRLGTKYRRGTQRRAADLLQIH
jgi:hypothetical protein